RRGGYHGRRVHEAPDGMVTEHEPSSVSRVICHHGKSGLPSQDPTFHQTRVPKDHSDHPHRRAHGFSAQRGTTRPNPGSIMVRINPTSSPRALNSTEA